MPHDDGKSRHYLFFCGSAGGRTQKIPEDETTPKLEIPVVNVVATNSCSFFAVAVDMPSNTKDTSWRHCRYIVIIPGTFLHGGTVRPSSVSWNFPTKGR
eukprot:scaffold1513_cov100-Amphora_coffeaeformis.AAC.15